MFLIVDDVSGDMYEFKTKPEVEKHIKSCLDYDAGEYVDHPFKIYKFVGETKVSTRLSIVYEDGFEQLL